MVGFRKFSDKYYIIPMQRYIKREQTNKHFFFFSLF